MIYQVITKSKTTGYVSTSSRKTYQEFCALLHEKLTSNKFSRIEVNAYFEK